MAFAPSEICCPSNMFTHNATVTRSASLTDDGCTGPVSVECRLVGLELDGLF